MTTRAKENLLHRLIASSAFVFALCILPVAQYLVAGKASSVTGEQGTVAGASTDQTIVEAAVPAASPTPDPNSCAARQQQLDQIAAQITSWESSFSSWESTTNQKYDQQIIDLAGTLSADELTARSAEIKAQKNQEIASYSASVDKEVAELSSQKEAVASRSCLAE